MAAKSQLSRAVFRAILANRPYIPAHCQRQLLQLTIRRHGIAPIYCGQKRGIFGIAFGATPRGLRHARNTTSNLTVALGHMVDLMRARRTESRPPPSSQVLDAFNYLFRSHLESPRRFSRNEIFLATETFQHLQQLDGRQDAGQMPLLSDMDITTALHSLASATGREKFRSDTQALAYGMFQELRSRSSDEHTFGSDAQSFKTLITILSRTGGGKEALELLRKSPTALERDNIGLWIAVIKGLASEGHLKEVLQVFDEMQRAVGVLDIESHEDLVTQFAETDNVNEARFFYETAQKSGFEPTLNTKLALAKMCIRNKNVELGNHIFETARPEEREAFEDLTLVWQVMQGVPVTQAMHSTISGLLRINHINLLMEQAYFSNDLAAAAKYLEFAQDQKLRPDAKTYLLQMRYQLKIGNLAGTVALFDSLSAEDPLLDNSDVPVLNKLLAGLCFSENPDFELVMRIVDRVIDRPIDLDAEALAGLCHVFLHRDELQDATGVLRHRVDSYPTPERARVSAVFRQFICDPAVEDNRAWNAYELFRHAFPETPVQQRLPLMHSFFDRKRSDLACLVFGHMRQREDIEGRPTAEAYAQCYEGIAKCRDVDGLQMTYNMLKLDREVEPSTRIRNGLIRAYTACELPWTAIIDHFWKIMDSREGPTMSSFALALRACEIFVPQGAQEARRIIAMMQSLNLYINRDIYHCYVGALAGQSEFENSIELIEVMEEDIGEKPDAITIGTFYNAIPWQYRRDEVEAWAKQAYPDLWEELLTYGETIDEEWEVRYFNVDRSIDIEDEPLFSQGQYNPQIAHDAQALLEPGGT